MTITQLKRRAHVVATLLSALDKGFINRPTFKAEPKAKKTAARKRWRFLYGWWLDLESTGILDADGKPTGHKIVRKFSHQPGDIIVSRSNKRTRGELIRYMVQPNHSLRRVTA